MLLGTSVYALGFLGGLTAFFSSFARGEINEVTRLVYDARENCLNHIRVEAEDLRADGVIGIKIFINEIGEGLVEVMAIGTAIRKQSGVSTHSDQLIPQAIIRDRDTFFEQAPIVPGAAQPRASTAPESCVTKPPSSRPGPSRSPACGGSSRCRARPGRRRGSRRSRLRTRACLSRTDLKKLTKWSNRSS